jgi:hypothetical protein
MVGNTATPREAAMTRYLLSVHTSADQLEGSMSDEEMRAGFERIGTLESQMKSKHVLVYSGRLEGPSAAAVVQVSAGKAVITDGPFVESKEVLGGFYIIEAESRADALEWAEKTTAAVGAPIEVRPFWSPDS